MQSSYDKPGMWQPSWHNFVAEVMKDLSFPQEIEICDMTLEGDGEEMPGMVFSYDEKIEIARKLDDVRIHRIDAGLVDRAHPEDLRVIKEIAGMGLRAKVTAYAEGESNINEALKCDLSEIWTELPATDPLMKNKLGLGRQEIIERATESITYAKKHGLSIRVQLIDAVRADPEFLKQFCVSVEECGGDAIGVSDSYGVSSPEGFRHLVRMVGQWTRLPIGIHCHNDFGLATANALAGLSAGAKIATACVNGIGERCGLTPTEVIAVALRILYGKDLGIDYEKLSELSKLVDKATGSVASDMRPIIGRRSFAWETDSHVFLNRKLDAVGHPEYALPFSPSFVGNHREQFIGKRSDSEAIRWKAQQMGVELNESQIENLRKKVRSLVLEKHIPSDQEFRKLLEEETQGTQQFSDNGRHV
jgi:methanogen homocitrate synthase